jgi:hypothetical protein
MQKIPKIEEQPLVYKMFFATNMEPWETITNRMMRLPNIQARSPMKVLEVDLEGWETIYSCNLQQKVSEIIEMSLSTQRYGNL